jgi:hypothetical protein
VPVNKLPSAALTPKHAGHTHSYRHEFLATADLGSPLFYLNDRREIIGGILRYEFDTADLSITVLRGGAG